MNKILFFAVCAVVGICNAAESCANMHPIVLMPGMMGTVLHATANIPTSVELPDYCPRTFNDQLIWIDVKQFLHYKCLAYYFRGNYNPETDKWEEAEGMEFNVPKWGTLYAIDGLAPGSLVNPFISYYHQMIVKFKGLGYVDGENLFGAGFDWKEVPSEKLINDLKELIEKAVKKNNGSKVVLIAHSMGGPYMYYFLMRQTPGWIKENVHMFIPIAPAWMGASKAFDYMLMGVDADVPLAGKYFAPLMRHIAGCWFLLPYAKAFPNMTLASTPSKTYTFDMLKDLLNDGNMSYVEGKLRASRKFYEDLKDFERFPGVPVREFHGYNKKTVYGLEFMNDIKPHDPDGMWEAASRIYGDGDATVPLPSLLYAVNKWKDKHEDVEVYSYKDLDHMDVIQDHGILEKIADLICT